MNSDLDISWHALCDRSERSGYASLSEDERAWLNLRSLIDAIENGGLISYFYNSGADKLDDCLIALRRLDAVRVLTCVERVAGLFGAEVPRTVDERNRIIDAWADGAHDKLLDAVDKELMPLVGDLDDQLDSFVSRHGLLGHV